MANPILPESSRGVRTHTFIATDGRRMRVVDDGDEPPHLETREGGFILGLCRYTGPEILKLASGGRALWNALSELLEALSVDGGGELVIDQADRAAQVLQDTAATFDHNEPEGSTRHPLVVKNGRASLAQPARHDPNRPIPLVPEVPRAD